MDQIGSNWIKLEQIGSDWIRLDQIGSNWIELDQLGSTCHKLDRIGSNWNKLESILYWLLLYCTTTLPDFQTGRLLCFYKYIRSDTCVRNDFLGPSIKGLGGLG